MESHRKIFVDEEKDYSKHSLCLFQKAADPGYTVGMVNAVYMENHLRNKSQQYRQL